MTAGEGRCCLDYTLSRAKFQELTADLLEQCKGQWSRRSRTPVSQERPRPHGPRRWLDPHARRRGARQGDDGQGPAQGRQPR
ncbi:MAG: hypothetical protein R2699_07180 [Acidimicrobiales bacterium]